jgi:hypothetical protein
MPYYLNLVRTILTMHKASDDLSFPWEIRQGIKFEAGYERIS